MKVDCNTDGTFLKIDNFAKKIATNVIKIDKSYSYLRRYRDRTQTNVMLSSQKEDSVVVAEKIMTFIGQNKSKIMNTLEVFDSKHQKIKNNLC